MKKLKFSLLIGLIFAFSANLSAQSLEIPGGNMERFRKDGLLPYQWFSPPPYVGEGVFSKSADAYSGTGALQFVFEPQKRHDNRRLNSPAIRLSSGKYKVSCFVKGKGEFRYITLTKRNEKTGSNNTESNIVGAPAIGSVDTNEWEKRELLYTIADDGHYNLHIGINSASKEQPLLIDDITIEKI